MKTCTCCNIEKELTEFYKRTASKDGLKSICKLCDNKKQIKYSKKYKSSNKDKARKHSKTYTEKHKDKVKQYKSTYLKTRKANDEIFKLKTKFRLLIFKSFKRRNFSKTSRTHQVLGCSFEELKQHLESQFQPWMNWGNYGKYNGLPNYGWDIDHIIPLAMAKTGEDVIKLNHYTNLQPLCSYVNRKVKRATL